MFPSRGAERLCTLDLRVRVAIKRKGTAAEHSAVRVGQEDWTEWSSRDCLRPSGGQHTPQWAESSRASASRSRNTRNKQVPVTSAEDAQGNNIGDVGAREMARGLANNNTVTWLSFEVQK